LVEITVFRLESKSCKGFFEKIDVQPMRALEFITGHMTYNLAYIYLYLADDNHQSPAKHCKIAKICRLQPGKNARLDHFTGID
jgi:hypothetical protein